MREKFIPALAATMAACAHSPSIKLSEIQPAENDAVAFCEELLSEQMPEERVPMNGGPDALLRSVEFRIDNTFVGIRCGYMDMSAEGQKPRPVRIDVGEGSKDKAVARYTDQFSFRDGAPGSPVLFTSSMWDPDGCIDNAWVDIGSSSQRRITPTECPPYTRQPRSQEDVAARAAQKRFTQITSGARALLRNRQLLPSRNK